MEDSHTASGIRLLREFDIGFKTSFDFLDFIPGTQVFKQWLNHWYNTLPKEEKCLFPGYLLASVGVKD